MYVVYSSAITREAVTRSVQVDKNLQIIESYISLSFSKECIDRTTIEIDNVET